MRAFVCVVAAAAASAGVRASTTRPEPEPTVVLDSWDDDKAAWNTAFPQEDNGFAAWIGEAPGFFTADSVTLGGGGSGLTLGVQYTDDGPGDTCNCVVDSEEGEASVHNVALGMVVSKTMYSHGFYETSFKAAATQGVVSAFWLQGSKGEISVAETVSTKSGRVWTASAVCFDGGTVEETVDLGIVFDPTAEFHTYGIGRGEDELAWWVDGELVKTMALSTTMASCLSEPMNVIGSVELLNKDVKEGEIEPAEMDIGYIKIWQSAEDNDEKEDPTEGDEKDKPKNKAGAAVPAAGHWATVVAAATAAAACILQ